jgi:hypothetical protein
MDFMLLLVGSKVRRISFTYRQKFIINRLLARIAMCEASGYCKKIWDKMSDEGAKIGSAWFG